MKKVRACTEPMKKRVYIIYTGGTIGMRPTPEGYAPAPGYLAAQIMAMPELANDLMPEVEIEEYNPLLDSANMSAMPYHTPAGTRRGAAKLMLSGLMREAPPWDPSPCRRGGVPRHRGSA